MKGEVLDVVKSADPAFASKAMGEGVAINPSEGIVYAPADGTISLIVPYKTCNGDHIKLRSRTSDPCRNRYS